MSSLRDDRIKAGARQETSVDITSIGREQPMSRPRRVFYTAICPRPRRFTCCIPTNLRFDATSCVVLPAAFVTYRKDLLENPVCVERFPLEVGHLLHFSSVNLRPNARERYNLCDPAGMQSSARTSSRRRSRSASIASTECSPLAKAAVA